MKIEEKIKFIYEFIDQSINVGFKVGLYEELIKRNMDGYLLSQSILNNLCEINDSGTFLINECFSDICTDLKIDPNKKYKNSDEVFSEWYNLDEE
jgi:hypothetical protein